MNIEKQQKKALGILWRLFDFNKVEIAKAAEQTPSTVIFWFKNGRISKKAAIKLENHERVKGHLTKEEMRPDVDEWFGV